MKFEKGEIITIIVILVATIMAVVLYVKSTTGVSVIANNGLKRAQEVIHEIE